MSNNAAGDWEFTASSKDSLLS